MTAARLAGTACMLASTICLFVSAVYLLLAMSTAGCERWTRRQWLFDSRWWRRLPPDGTRYIAVFFAYSVATLALFWLGTSLLKE